MTNAQLYLAMGVPMLFNAVLIGFVLIQIQTLEAHMNARFDDMKDMWRAELRRVEELFGARLKHLEER